MAEVKATAAPAPAKPAQTAPAPLPAAAKAAPEKPVEKPPVRKKVAGVAAGDDGDIWRFWWEMGGVYKVFGSNKNGEKMYTSEIYTPTLQLKMFFLGGEEKRWVVSCWRLFPHLELFFWGEGQGTQQTSHLTWVPTSGNDMFFGTGHFLEQYVETISSNYMWYWYHVCVILEGLITPNH